MKKHSKLSEKIFKNEKNSRDFNTGLKSVILIIMFLVFACSGGSENAKLQMQITALNSSGQYLAADGLADTVKSAKFSIDKVLDVEKGEKVNLKQIDCQDISDQKSIKLEVPIGTNLTINFEGYKDAGCTGSQAFQGRVNNITVQGGETTVVQMMALPLKSSLEIATMSSARFFHAATKLKDGSVLLSGGFESGTCNQGKCISLIASDTLAIYYPGNGKVYKLPVKLNKARALHTATLLNDNQGRILIVGGVNSGTLQMGKDQDALLVYNKKLTDYVPQVEILDPTAFDFNVTEGFTLKTGATALTVLKPSNNASNIINKMGHTTTKVNNRIFFFGGDLAGGAASLAYCLVSGTSVSCNSYYDFEGYDLLTALNGHTATVFPLTGPSALLLFGGNPLVEDGKPGNYAFKYTLAGKGKLEVTDFAKTGKGKALHYQTATLFSDADQKDKLLVTGGVEATTTRGGFSAASKESFVLATDADTFPTAINMNSARVMHRAVKLESGDILLIGGMDEKGEVAGPSKYEIFSVSKGKFSFNDLALATGRIGHDATLLDDGTVLVSGGFDGDAGLKSLEIFIP